jgi:hypothetical protein
MPKITRTTSIGSFVQSRTPIGEGDLVTVLMPDGRHYEVAEILTVNADADPDGPGRVTHTLILADESYGTAGMTTEEIEQYLRDHRDELIENGFEDAPQEVRDYALNKAARKLNLAEP